MHWDPNTDKIVAPGHFAIPNSLIEEEIRAIIIENHPRTFAYFNCIWGDFYGHTLKEFDPKLIKTGKSEGLNTRAIYIDTLFTEEIKGNTTERTFPLAIEIITGNEQLAGDKAFINPIKIVGQNYAEGVLMIFSTMPRQRLLKGIPRYQPKPVAGIGGAITYTLTDAKVVAETNPVLTLKSVRTDLDKDDQNKPIARSQITFDLKIPLIKTIHVDPYNS